MTERGKSKEENEKKAGDKSRFRFPWLFVIGLVIIAAVVGFMYYKGIIPPEVLSRLQISKTQKPEEAEIEEEEEIAVPEPDTEDPTVFANIITGEIVKKEIIQIKNNWYVAIYESNYSRDSYVKAVEDWMNRPLVRVYDDYPAVWGKIVVAKYYPAEDRWYGIWQSPLYGTVDDTGYSLDPRLKDKTLYVTGLNDRHVIFAVFPELPQGDGYYENAVAVALEEGNVFMLDKIKGYMGRLFKEDGKIVYETRGLAPNYVERYAIYPKDEGFAVDKFYRSEIAPGDAEPLKFIIASNGEIIPAGRDDIRVPVGRTLAMVPADEDTKKRFNTYEIDIRIVYNGEELKPVELTRIVRGNSFTPHFVGDYLITLYHTKETGDTVSGTLKPTFTVRVEE